MKTLRKTTLKSRRQRSRRSRYLGGTLDLNLFVQKLKDISAFLHAEIASGSEAHVASLVQERFGELLHVKSVNPIYPDIREHLVNMDLILSHLVVTSTTNLQGEQAEHPLQSKASTQEAIRFFPATGCLDAKLDWISELLFGLDTQITSQNKNAKVSEIIAKKLAELEERLKHIKTRYEYEEDFKMDTVFITLITHNDINRAIRLRIISQDEVRDLFYTFAADQFENGMFVGQGIHPIPPPEKTTFDGGTEITSLPVRFIPKGSTLYDPTGTRIGTVGMDTYYKIWIYVITPTGGTMIELKVGMKYSPMQGTKRDHPNRTQGHRNQFNRNQANGNQRNQTKRLRKL